MDTVNGLGARPRRNHPRGVGHCSSPSVSAHRGHASLGVGISAHPHLRRTAAVEVSKLGRHDPGGEFTRGGSSGFDLRFSLFHQHVAARRRAWHGPCKQEVNHPIRHENPPFHHLPPRRFRFSRCRGFCPHSIPLRPGRLLRSRGRTHRRGRPDRLQRSGRSSRAPVRECRGPQRRRRQAPRGVPARPARVAAGPACRRLPAVTRGRVFP